MIGRWGILALLFAVRIAMAFQFQSLGALGPILRHDLGYDLARIGFLIGIYLVPGLVLAWPGGAIGRRFGDKRVVLAGLVLMVAGGLLVALGSSPALQTTGRLLSGTGGVLLNVLMSKMVTDWFASAEIATAMAIFVNSWPAGIALALLVLPPTAVGAGLTAALLLAVALPALGACALAALYPAPSPPPAATEGSTAGSAPAGRILAALVLAGIVWGLYNSSIGMIFSFGASLLVERGWSIPEASRATSLALWLTVLSVPLGGILADRTGRPGTVLIGGLVGFAALLALASRTEASLAAFAALGLVCGLPAGPIMNLPARILAPSMRATGMGIFYTLFYACVVAAPWAAGLAAQRAGQTGITFDLGAALLLTCVAGVALFERLARRGPAGRDAVTAPR